MTWPAPCWDPSDALSMISFEAGSPDDANDHDRGDHVFEAMHSPPPSIAPSREAGPVMAPLHLASGCLLLLLLLPPAACLLLLLLPLPLCQGPGPPGGREAMREGSRPQLEQRLGWNPAVLRMPAFLEKRESM